MFSIIRFFLFFLCVVMGSHSDFQERFLERKIQRQIKDNRIDAFDADSDDAPKDNIAIDDIMHYRVNNKSSSIWKRARSIEKDYRRMIAMDGMKYNYKRDLYWRTWRHVSSVTGDKIYVCYKCNNPLHVNTTGCQNCGMWTIEEGPPPCPYEFFSVISDQELCGANYTQYKNVNSSCPSIIKFSELTATCDNPIETEWRFSKLYGITETYKSVICGGKDFCEIFTLYEISPEHVIFRIVNSTNDVMYSRIMKNNKLNYICVEDCGRFNPNTRKVTKTDKPLKLDLLSAPIDKKDDEPVLPVERTPLPLIKEFKKAASLSNSGGKIVYEDDHVKSKVMKRHYFDVFDFPNMLREFGNPSTTCPTCQKLGKQEEPSPDEENEHS